MLMLMLMMMMTQLRDCVGVPAGVPPQSDEAQMLLRHISLGVTSYIFTRIQDLLKHRRFCVTFAPCLHFITQVTVNEEHLQILSFLCWARTADDY